MICSSAKFIFILSCLSVIVFSQPNPFASSNNNSKPSIEIDEKIKVSQQQTIVEPLPQPTPNDQSNTQPQAKIQVECRQTCKELSHYLCTICYQQCKGKNFQSFQMNTCEFKQCTFYKSEPLNEEDPTSTITRCTQWESKLVSENQCTELCCAKPNYQAFTRETFNQCVEVNQSKSKTENLIGTIIGAVLGSTLGLLIILVIACCCKERVIKCWSNMCFCLAEKLCCGIFNEQKRQNTHKKQNKESTEDSNEAKSDQKVQRVNRRWKIEKKGAGALQPPTSKHMIYTENGINPQIYCSICLDDKLNCETACKHGFHFLCLRESLIKKFICPECNSKKINPLKVICEICHQRSTSYSINKENVNTKYPDFYNKSKIYCGSCLDQYYKSIRQQQ